MFVLPHPQFWKVRVGEHHLKRPESSEKIVEVSHVYYYPWYHGYDNDLALFRLKKPLEFGDYVKPICLADEDTQFSGLTCVASGWGKVDFRKFFAPITFFRDFHYLIIIFPYRFQGF